MLRYLPIRKIHARQILDSRGNPTVENHDRKSGSTVERQIQIINIDVALLETEKQFVQITNLILYLDSKNIT